MLSLFSFSNVPVWTFITLLYSLLSSSFPPPPTAEMDIRYTAQTAKAMHSNWNFSLLLSIRQLFRRGRVLTVPVRGRFVPVLTLQTPVVHGGLPRLEHSCRRLSAHPSTAAWLLCPLLTQIWKFLGENRVASARAGLSGPVDEQVKWLQTFLFPSSSLFPWDIAGSTDTFERWCDKNTNKINPLNNTILSRKQLAIVSATSSAFLSCVKNTCGSQSTFQTWRTERGQVYSTDFCLAKLHLSKVWRTVFPDRHSRAGQELLHGHSYIAKPALSLSDFNRRVSDKTGWAPVP